MFLLTLWQPLLLDRLLRRQLWRYFGAILLILIAILISFRLSNLLSAAAKGDIALSAIAPMIVLQMLRFTLLLAPIVYVLASALVLGRLHSSLEHTALRACGIGSEQQLRALLSLAVPLSALILFAQLFILPAIYLKQESLLQRARQDAAMAFLAPNRFRLLADGRVFYAKALSEQGMEQFFYQHTPTSSASDAPLQQTLIFSSSAQFDVRQRAVVLNDGIHLQSALSQAESDVSEQSLLHFERAELTFPEPEIERRALLRHLFPSELDDSPAHRSEWLNRFNPAISLLIYSLFLPLLAHQKPRSAQHQRVLPIFLGYASYITVLDLLASLSKKQALLWFASPLLHGMMLLFAWWLWRRKT
ncbi:MAG: LptF/LptG family permease [Cardiobacteriaceae bacterium]|nr:LptF/LptG family permease [Cardiobacteriaceae bacterium]